MNSQPEFSAFITAATITNLNHSQLLSLKHAKEKLCTCKPCARFLCKRCKKISAHLCRKYHATETFEEELALRLLDEFLFGFIKFGDIICGTWKAPCGRDHGHHLRILKIANRCCTEKIKWAQESNTVSCVT